MAIVADLSGNYAGFQTAPDKPLSRVNRRISGSPYGGTVPQYTGELALDVTTGQIWEAAGLTVSDWVPVTKVV